MTDRPTAFDRKLRALLVVAADQILRSKPYRAVLDMPNRDPEQTIRALEFWRWQATKRREGEVRW